MLSGSIHLSNQSVLNDSFWVFSHDGFWHEFPSGFCIRFHVKTHVKSMSHNLSDFKSASQKKKRCGMQIPTGFHVWFSQLKNPTCEHILISSELRTKKGERGLAVLMPHFSYWHANQSFFVKIYGYVEHEKQTYLRPKKTTTKWSDYCKVQRTKFRIFLLFMKSSICSRMKIECVLFFCK